jgi:hypothetical protein
MTYRVVFRKGASPDELYEHFIETETQRDAITMACAQIALGGCLDLHIVDGEGSTVLTERQIAPRCKG